MYCGDSFATDIDHHEPIKRNPLRAFDWLNHLLACSRCNSHYKGEQFPVDERGEPLLIDPTAEDPFDHLTLALSTGVFTALTRKGEVTNEVCGLNVDRRPSARVHAREQVIASLERWAAASARDDVHGRDVAVRTIRDQPFAAVCQAMLRQADRSGAEIVFEGTPAVLPLLRDPELRAALLR